MKDDRPYRVTFRDGSIRHYGRKGMAAAISNPYVRRVAKVERIPESGWVDVTAEFLKPKDV